MSSPRFLLDENVHTPHNIIRWLKEENITCEWVGTVGLLEADDPTIFSYAVEHGYVLVTGNIIGDFQPLVASFVSEHGDFPGIVYITANRYKNLKHIVDKLIHIAHTYDQNHVEWWI